MAAQFEREILVGAFLDMTLDQWYAWVETDPKDIPDHVEPHAAAAFEGLGTQIEDPVKSGMQYLQAMATLSDDSMRWLVKAVSGKDPLEV